MDPLSFTVVGSPVPKGALTAFPVKTSRGYAHHPDGRPVIATKATDDRAQATQAAISRAALEARNAAGVQLCDAAVSITVRCFYVRPKSHYGTGRNANVLKASALAYPTTRADVDKLARLVLDALTGVIYRDDSQVIDLMVTKQWGDPARTEVCVESMAAGTYREQLQPELLAA